MEERSRWEGKREKKKGEKGNARRGWYPSQCIAFEGDDASLCKSRDPDGSREGRIYKEEREVYGRKTGGGKEERYGTQRGPRGRGRWEWSILDSSRILLAGILGSSLHKDHPLPLPLLRDALFSSLFFYQFRASSLFFSFLSFFLPPVPFLTSSHDVSALATFIPLSLPLPVRLLSRLLNSVTKPSSHLLSVLLAFQDPPRLYRKSSARDLLCTRVLPPSPQLSLSLFLSLPPPSLYSFSSFSACLLVLLEPPRYTRASSKCVGFDIT